MSLHETLNPAIPYSVYGLKIHLETGNLGKALAPLFLGEGVAEGISVL